MTTNYIVLCHNNDIDGPAHWVVYVTPEAAKRAAQNLSKDWPYVAVRPVQDITLSIRGGVEHE